MGPVGAPEVDVQLEFNELALRCAELRIAEPGRQARLDPSSAREGQQSPVLVMVAEGERFVLVDGYRRVASLKRLGHDVVEAVALPLEEPTAVEEGWRLETFRRRTALEDGWLLAELLERHGRSQVALAALVLDSCQVA
jgi:ParB-like chromosome segregation protein Spo0J